MVLIFSNCNNFENRGTMGAPSGKCGSIYEHIENEIVYHDAERVALDSIYKVITIDIFSI